MVVDLVASKPDTSAQAVRPRVVAGGAGGGGGGNGGGSRGGVPRGAMGEGWHQQQWLDSKTSEIHCCSTNATLMPESALDVAGKIQSVGTNIE